MSTLKLKKRVEDPHNLRFIERKGRYILQERLPAKESLGAIVDARWRDVPLVMEKQ